MRKSAAALLTLSAASLTALATPLPTDWTVGFQEGNPRFQSISQLAFGPENILFLADTKAAAVVALALQETGTPDAARPILIENINLKIAALLGTTAEEILIGDLAVHPASHNAYLAVSRGRGPAAVPVLVRVSAEDNKLEVVSLEKVKFSRAELPDAPIEGVVGAPDKQSNPRLESITDIAFLEDRVLVAGLSNEEFSSTLRAIPFPFKTAVGTSSVEIYHGAHGRFETRAPIRTFVAFNIGNEPSLLAAYTCTPLVQIPIKALLPGAKIKGKTIAELGNKNRPLDLIVYEKGGKDYLLLANSSRAVMKVSTEEIATAEGIVEPVKGGATKGLHYESVEGWTGVTQLARFDAGQALVLRTAAPGVIHLQSLPLP